MNFKSVIGLRVGILTQKLNHRFGKQMKESIERFSNDEIYISKSTQALNYCSLAERNAVAQAPSSERCTILIFNLKKYMGKLNLI